MTTPPTLSPLSAEAPPEAAPRPRRQRLVHSSDVWILLAVAVVVIMFISGMAERLRAMFYGPTALAVLVALIIQFLVLKARDRSRFYRLQLHMISNRRREDLCLLRETRDNLAEATKTLRALRERIETPGPDVEETGRLLSELEEQVRNAHQDICRR
jgi:hypothetical protein